MEKIVISSETSYMHTHTRTLRQSVTLIDTVREANLHISLDTYNTMHVIIQLSDMSDCLCVLNRRVKERKS